MFSLDNLKTNIIVSIYVVLTQKSSCFCQNKEQTHLTTQYFTTFSTICQDGYLKVYLRGQEATDSYDKHDAELCGEGSSDPLFPPPLLSDGPRLVMVFSSGELQGRGFKAKYTFETGELVR